MCDESEHMFLDPDDIAEGRWGRQSSLDGELVPGVWMKHPRLATNADLDGLDSMTRAKWEQWL